MASAAFDPSLGLQSSDHRDLLNVIDELRSEGKTIVCGDQSSGKSSVLEAVSGFPFPRKDNLCTRFATEVILRRNATEHAKVDIIPGPDRTNEEKAKLATFVKTEVELAQLERLINDAKFIMGVGTDMRSFSSDILHVEIAGPSQPHLTLVDLPGLFRAANRLQTDDDAEAVTSLVRSYMIKERSIILAVVSAKNDFANQIGSESEKSFIDLAQNKDIAFRLGWHVVRNRDFDAQSSSTEERDRVERESFQSGVWAHLPGKAVGIAALKDRLSRVLQDQISNELPKLLEDVECGLRGCGKTLDQLGTPRTTFSEQRLYLHGVSERFTYLAKAAIEGSYQDIFFGNPHKAPGIVKRFRAVAQNASISFAETMRKEGHQRSVVDSTNSETAEGDGRLISREAFIDEVLPLMRNTRGRELPGTYSPHLIADLFFEQAQRWEGLTRGYISQLWDRTTVAIGLILNHVADSRTAEQLLRRIVHPALEGIKFKLDDAVSGILAPHQAGHPITYNHYFIENLQKLRQKRQRQLLSKKLDQFFGTNSDEGLTWCEGRTVDVKSLLTTLTESSMPDMDRFACSEAIDGMMAYYKVAMKTLVDDIAVLAVERCLLKNIPELLPSRTIISLSDDQISTVAAESDDARAERSRAEKEHRVLTKARAMLRRLDQSHPSELDFSTFQTRSNEDIASNAGAASSERSTSFGTNSTKDYLGTIRQGLTAPLSESSAPLDYTLSTNDVLVNGTLNALPQEDHDDWGMLGSKKKKKKMLDSLH
ncbi:hypothetical protein A1O1_04568 [Capronia coronata CBS 617.96]|uniref:GED domain-containing protein n=1 Tax=Capronia coronata CBS 617.96 TaxID=1182541 RepID=W9YZC2_9EURO|nr:uncharacterized protein A1O1_04568 [Capronia coronata CBS 617.96]EXJ87644.1 hypothetical protein A1O1_04568 [Capronia coronata CBS 617.96]